MICGLLGVETPTNFCWVEWVRFSGNAPEHIVITCWRNASARLRTRTHHAIGVWRSRTRFFEDLGLTRAQLCIHIIEFIRLRCHILTPLPNRHHVSAHDCIIWALGRYVALPLLLVHRTLHLLLWVLLLLIEGVVVWLLLHLHCHHVWWLTASNVFSTPLALLILLIHTHLLLLVSLVSHLV